MEQKVNTLKEKLTELQKELSVAYRVDGSINKSAAKRARLMTNDLTKEFKQFRKDSVQAEK